MKYILTCFVFVCLALKASAGTTDTIKIQTKTYCDHCKQCESCWLKMEKDLAFTKGVKAVSFDEATMVITVIYNPKKTNQQKLRKVVSLSGFDADEVKADVKAQNKLDTCCKKKD